MDSSNNAQVQPGNSNAKLERKVKILYVVILILVVAMAFMIFNTQKVANERNESFAQGVQLRGELDKVMEDYNDIRMENQDLVGQMSDKDSLIMANKKEIERLIARQADYNKIKKKLKHLFNNNQLHTVVEPLEPAANDLRLYQSIGVKIKQGRIHGRLAFRFYAVEIEEKRCYLITGAAIKIHKDMLKAPNTKIEKNKIEFALKELIANGIDTKELFIDFVL